MSLPVFVPLAAVVTKDCRAPTNRERLAQYRYAATFVDELQVGTKINWPEPKQEENDEVEA